MKKVMLILMLAVVCVAGCKKKPLLDTYTITTYYDGMPVESVIDRSTGRNVEWESLRTEAPEFVFEVTETEDFTFDVNDLSTSITDWDMPANISISVNNIEVLFMETDGKFDIVYDPNKCTESAEAFFVCFDRYFEEQVRKVKENE